LIKKIGDQTVNLMDACLEIAQADCVIYEVQVLLIVKHRHPDYPIADQKEKIWTGDWADHSDFRQNMDVFSLA
jgi:hypothetical protein